MLSFSKDMIIKHKGLFIEGMRVGSLLLVIMALLYTTPTSPLIVHYNGKETSVEINPNNAEVSIENQLSDLSIEEFEISSELNSEKQIEEIYINTAKDITVVINGEEITLKTYNNTVYQLIDELEANFSNESNIRYVLKTDIETPFIYDQQKLEFEKLTTETEEIEEYAYLDTVYEDDDSMYIGQTAVETVGIPTIENNTYEYSYRNGELVDTNIIDTEIIQEGVAQVVKVGTKEPTKDKSKDNSSSSSKNWDAVASCESGGNWSINTGNGYYGGLQFSQSTWDWASSAAGVSADRADLASKSEQIAAAEQVYASQGAGAWGACSSYL